MYHKKEKQKNPYYPHLFEPFQIKNTYFKNRIFSAPNMICHMDANGFPSDYMIAYYAEKAKGGAAVVTVGDTPVDREHAATNPRSLNLSYESLPYMSELAMAIHEYGAVASLELNHGGIAGTPQANFGGDPWGPVELYCDPEGNVLNKIPDANSDYIYIHGMTPEDMDTVAEHFAEKAYLLKTAGFDMCLIHGGHGWLLDQFISPLYNTRTDEYGGSLENRAKFPLMVIDRVRQRCGEDFLIEYRMSGSEEISGGLSKEEGIAFAKMLDGKVDILHVSTGLDIEEAQAVRTHPTMFLPHGVNVHYAADIKAAGVQTPIVTVGAITDPGTAEKILAEGKADIIAMTRALIADPHFPNKAKCGRVMEIIPCLRCLDCLTGMHNGQHFQCSVNISTGREFRYRNYIQPTRHLRRVLVVGGGPGGMKAAITAAERGHEVTLAEASGELGGLLKFTDYDELKIDLMRLKNHLIYRAEHSNMMILLNTLVTSEFIQAGDYDAVILAVGSVPSKPPIPGLDHPSMKHAATVYEHPDWAGENTVILGGGLIGCETALFLAKRGHNVTIIEMCTQIASEANWMHKEGMMQAMNDLPIICRTGVKVTEIIPHQGVKVLNESGEAEMIPADSIIYALGMKSNIDIVSELADVCPETWTIGDCVKPGRVKHTLADGFWAAINLG